MDKLLAEQRRAEGLRRTWRKRNGSRDRAIIRMYETGKHSLQEVGQRFGLSKQAVYIIVARERANGGPK